jgi:hypothetical protein
MPVTFGSHDETKLGHLLERADLENCRRIETGLLYIEEGLRAVSHMCEHLKLMVGGEGAETIEKLAAEYKLRIKKEGEEVIIPGKLG